MPDINWINLALNLATIVVVGGGALYAARVKGRVQAQQDLVNLLKEEVDAVRGRANRLHDELDESLRANRDLQASNTKLESLPDMTRLLEEMTAQRQAGERRALESVEAVTRMFEGHEKRAEEREKRAEERHRLIVESFIGLNAGLSEINKSLRALNGGASGREV